MQAPLRVSRTRLHDWPGVYSPVSVTSLGFGKPNSACKVKKYAACMCPGPLVTLTTISASTTASCCHCESKQNACESSLRLSQNLKKILCSLLHEQTTAHSNYFRLSVLQAPSKSQSRMTCSDFYNQIFVSTSANSNGLRRWSFVGLYHAATIQKWGGGIGSNHAVVLKLRENSAAIHTMGWGGEGGVQQPCIIHSVLDRVINFSLCPASLECVCTVHRCCLDLHDRH